MKKQTKEPLPIFNIGSRIQGRYFIDSICPVKSKDGTIIDFTYSTYDEEANEYKVFTEMEVYDMEVKNKIESTKKKYKINGRIKVSGKWFMIKDIAKYNKTYVFKVIHKDTNKNSIANLSDVVAYSYSWINEELVEAYVNPNDDWIGDDYKNYTENTDLIQSINSYLNKKYGEPPIVRKFHNEDASWFGLEPNDKVLYWSSLGGWDRCPYSALTCGDKWMKQPKKPGFSEKDLASIIGNLYVPIKT